LLHVDLPVEKHVDDAGPVAIISPGGISPLSIMRVTRGKLVCGKTLEGMFEAA
jgi:hypothetical protein